MKYLIIFYSFMYVQNVSFSEDVKLNIINSEYVLSVEVTQNKMTNVGSPNKYIHSYSLSIESSEWRRPVWKKYLVRPADVGIDTTSFISILSAVKIDDKVYFIYNDSGVLLIETIEYKMMRWITTDVEVLSDQFSMFLFESLDLRIDNTLIHIDLLTSNGAFNYTFDVINTEVLKSKFGIE